MSNLLSGPQRPSLSPPARMPDPQSPEVEEAKRREIASRLARGGRQSTILTTPATRPAGYDSFAATKTGAG